jgi:hypothetical protein
MVLQNTFDGDGARLIRTVSSPAKTTHYVGDWYECDPTAAVATVYYPFNGKPVAMESGSSGTVTYLHQDHLGSLVSATNTSGTEVASPRYSPSGGLRLGTGTLPTDRLYTGQIRDLVDVRFYWFKCCFYDRRGSRYMEILFYFTRASVGARELASIAEDLGYTTKEVPNSDDSWLNVYYSPQDFW